MNTETQRVLTNLLNGEDINRNTLRNVARELKVTQGKTKAELVSNLTGFAKKNLAVAPKVSVKKGPGRPPADPNNIVGYKVKIGLRYPTGDGSLTTNMREGKVFETVEEGQKVVKDLVDNGQVRVWGGSVRAKFLPRYGSSK